VGPLQTPDMSPGHPAGSEPKVPADSTAVASPDGSADGLADTAGGPADTADGQVSAVVTAGAGNAAGVPDAAGVLDAAGVPTARVDGGPVMPSWRAVAACRPLAAGGARLTSGLLRSWQRRNATASMPLALVQLESAGNLDNLRLAIAVEARRAAIDAVASPGPGDRADRADRAATGAGPAPNAGRYRPRDPADASSPPASVVPPADLGYHGPLFMDSDIYKTLEAIGWELASGPRPDLAEFAARAIELLARVQRPDGYLNSYIQVSGEPRYARLALSHEMYCAGHLIQAAIGLRRGAGDARALTIASRLADHLVAEFGGRERGLDGHPIIETALVELYRETGNRAYLELAAQFVDQRGHGLAGDSGMGHRYLQDHLPVRESGTEVGHAVRALYLEAGVTDVAVETGDAELLRSSIRRWDDMVATKTYLTGGNGSRHVDEGFGDRFELPPDRAYNETCAAIASFHWSWRLLLATGAAKYADHMERVLYNGFGAAISADGDRFFYVNPLQRRADHHEKDDPGRRRIWFSCACCPPNIMRLLASVQHYLATVSGTTGSGTTGSGDTLHLHQYAGARVSGADLDIEVVTEYPWSGLIKIRVLSAAAAPRTMALRIPSWSAGAAAWTLNNDPERSVAAADGYLRIVRRWQAGDEVMLRLDMTPRWSFADRRVDAVRGCAAVERGPLVYCFEQPDQPGPLAELAVNPGAPLTERRAAIDGVGDTVTVTVPAVLISTGLASTGSASTGSASTGAVTAVAIPYCQWDNRDAGPMRVWMPAP
jgi:uncharacterized protein